MHEVLVNRLGGLSLPRKSVVRLTDRPDMTLDVYRGRKTTIQQQPPTIQQLLTLPVRYLRRNVAERRKKKPWVTGPVQDFVDERIDLKKRRYNEERCKKYRKANKRVQNSLKKAKEDKIDIQCKENKSER